MAFRMATPYRHPKTGVYWFRKAVPTALQAAVGAKMFQRTLDTKDPEEARRRFVQVAADVQEHWAALLVVPDRMTPRARLALAGEFYRWSVARHTEDPGKPDHWENRIQLDMRQLRPSGGRIPAPWMVIDDDLESFLAERKIHVAESDMWDLVIAAANAALLARRTLLQQATGDYRPNPEAERFPAYVAPTPVREPMPSAKQSGDGRLTLHEHWDAFVTERKLSLGTQKRWRPLIHAFEKHLGRDNLATATPLEIGNWKLALIAGGKLSNVTIGDGYLAALRTFYNFGVANGKLKENPCENIRVAKEKVVEDKPAEARDFKPHQCALILSESLREPDPRTSPRFAAARRWIPWLCAYTGARVNEMSQLRKQDLLPGIVGQEKVWEIRITPSAGTVKGNKARDVPVHPHLVEMGFVAFVQGCDDGPLFYDPKRGRGGSKFNPTFRKVGDKLARWVREIGVDDPDIDPNHGWRHSFKTAARRARMSDEVREGIAGHATRTVGQKYGDMPLDVKWAEITLLPRFDVSPPTGPLPMTDARRQRNEQRVATSKRAKRVAKPSQHN